MRPRAVLSLVAAADLVVCLAVLELRDPAPPSHPVRPPAAVRVVEAVAVPVRTAAPAASRSPRVRTPLRAARHLPGPRARLERALRRIPGFRPGAARWVLTTAYGHWGDTDLVHLVVYVSPRVPAARMYDVVAHEWSHVVSMRDYGGDVPTAVAALRRVFGGRGLVPAERAADCMARLLGARWTGYTRCDRSDWRAAARRLLAGHRL